MKEDKFDDMLRERLKKETEHIETSSFLKDNIDREIMRRQEESRMKKFSFKKFVVVAAAVCLMVPASILAAGKISGYVSHVDLTNYVRTNKWSELGEIEKKVGIKTDAIEEFSNGYKMKEISTHFFDAQDDDGNVMFTVKELDIQYQNKEKPILWATMHKTDERMKNAEEESEDKPKPSTIKEYAGIKVECYNVVYKFVPPDYELTDEDNALLEQGNFTISYGTDEVQIQQNKYVSWEKNGVSYNLMGFDLDLTDEEMLDMTRQMIEK